MQPRAPEAKWVPVENLHVTLSFLGHVPDEQIPEIGEALAASVAGAVDFPTNLEGVAAFPSARRARVLWVGLYDAAGGIAGIARGVQEGLVPLGFEPEKRAFAPHVTLARLRVPRAVDLEGIEVEPVRFDVERVTLFQSFLARPAPRYEAVATFPFRRATAPPRAD